MKRKSAAAVLLCLLLLLSLPGCTQAAEEAPLSVGLCWWDREATDTAPLRACLEQQLHHLGYPLSLHDAARNAQTQTAQVEKLVTEGCDLVVLETTRDTDLEAITLLLLQAKVPCLFLGEDPGSGVLTLWEHFYYVGYDPTAPARIQSRLVLELPDRGDLNGNGSTDCLVLSGPEDSPEADLHRNNCTQVDSSIEALQISAGAWTQEDGYARMANAISRFGRDIEVVLCGNDALALGAVAALTDFGRTPGADIYVLSIGGEAEALEALEAGTLSATVGNDPEALSEAITRAARALLTGQSLSKRTYIPGIPLTIS